MIWKDPVVPVTEGVNPFLYRGVRTYRNNPVYAISRKSGNTLISCGDEGWGPLPVK